MSKSILVGPVPGLPAAESIAFIVSQIISAEHIPDGMKLYETLTDGFQPNPQKGCMMINIKPHMEESLEDLLLALGKRVQEVSAGRSQPIPCIVVDRDFELGGDDDGGVSDRPRVGPRPPVPTLHQHSPLPESERGRIATGGIFQADQIVTIGAKLAAK